MASRPGTGRVGIGLAIARRSWPVGVELGSSKDKLVETGSDEKARDNSDELARDVSVRMFAGDAGRDELVDTGSEELLGRLGD